MDGFLKLMDNGHRQLKIAADDDQNFGFGFGNQNLVRVFWISVSISVSCPNFGKNEIILNYMYFQFSKLGQEKIKMCDRKNFKNTNFHT
jgi:hypothetical protein